MTTPLSNRLWRFWTVQCAVLVLTVSSVHAQKKRSKAQKPSDATVQSDGGVPMPTMDGGTPSVTAEDATPADADGGAAMPWSEASPTKSSDIPLPSFLDTTDKRMHDERGVPSEANVRALNEMREELGRMQKSGAAFRTILDSIVKREYIQRRQVLDQRFARQIAMEEASQTRARDNAIALFEKFVAKYPDDPAYTPDAMFRLGELYYERSAIEFQNAQSNARVSDINKSLGVNGSDGGMPAVQTARRDTPDFTPTVELFQRLAKNFPKYRNIGGVYYLVGYCLNEMGEPDDARMAWLNLVCANKFSYVPKEQAPPPSLDGADKEEQEDKQKKEHPSLTMGGSKAADAGPYSDPYTDCKPVQKDAQFIAETWMRIGEYHFDLDYGPHGLDRAISAYMKLLEMPEDRNYNLSLYKLAWSYYRASRYGEAVRYFSKLVQWSDDEQKRTGKAGSELRAEAIQYMAIAFAYDDWNENQVPDPQEQLPTGIERVQDAGMMPQEKPWTAEVYFQLGNVYFDEVKYPDAIRVWQLTLKKFPSHERAPELQNMIARAYARNNQMEEAILARSRLSDYIEGSAWWNANLDHPDAQRKAEELAESSLVTSAVAHHTKAQDLRRRGVESQDPDLIKQAQDQYALAAEAYRLYIKRYPNSPQAYELRYNLADTLFWSDNFEGAATEYAAVRDSNLDDTHLSEGARRVVESLRRLVERAEQAGQLTVRDKPPEAVGTPKRVSPVQMPDLLQRLAQARELYLARVDDTHDTENVRESYDYNNAVLLYQYGYWPQAKQRFARIFDERCSGPTADETGRVAWLNMRNMAVVEGDNDSVESLGKSLSSRKCAFGKGAAAYASVDCTLPKNREEPQCLAGQDLTNLKYLRAVELFAKAEKTPGNQQRALYEQASSMLVNAVNQEPNHPQAPLALEKAAIALERTDRFESAGRLYQRVIDDIGPKKAASPEEQKTLDAILSNAHFRLAFNANRFFDYDKAVENYRVLADSTRFQKSEDPGMAERREGALINAATILEYQQQYTRAAEYYRRAADTLKDPDEQRAARYRVAEMAYKNKNYGTAIKEMKAFADRYTGDQKAGELVVQATWRIAQSHKALHHVREYKESLAKVAETFARSGQPAGSIAAEYAAEAKFEIVDEGSQAFETFAIKPGKPKTMQNYIQSITSQIDGGSKEAKKRAESYNGIPEYRRPTWTIGAFVHQGRIYEVLAKAVLNTPFIMPSDLTAKVKRAPPEAREEVRIQVEDAVRQVLDKQVRPIECLALVRYALAARAAKAGSLDNDFTRQAVDRLQAYGDERISECLTQASAADKSLGAYVPGEFTRATRGLNMTMPTSVAAPPLAPREAQ